MFFFSGTVANMANLMRFFILLLHLIVSTIAVDKGNFKTCEQSSFCRRLRKIKPDNPKYFLDLDSLQLSDNSVEAELVNTDDNVKLKFSLTTLADDTFRVIIDEYKPLHARYRVEGALNGEPQVAKLELLERDRDVVSVKLGNNKATMTSDPFKVEFYQGDTLVAVVNSRNLFEFEHLRVKPVIKFKHPLEMQQNLTATGRKLIVIIDPHIKREGGYFLHEEALSNDYYIKTKDGNVYEGWCWPGASSYLDLFNPAVTEYYSKLYAHDKFIGSTDTMYIWNDMNEPSVFNGPEVTMPKDCVHYGGWEHRHVHNIHGYYYTKTTFDGLLQRTPNTRPFILTRSFFSGSQRHAAVWTGDNAADWSHLAISFPMCLSMAVSGFSFCGADIGGFFHSPDTELLQRWYQAGAWLPFYRAHAHLDTKRREPYLFDQDVQTRIRNALRLRYAHLPVWYTLFWEHSKTAEPVIRPLIYQYPSDSNVLDIDYQLLVGSSILVRPVVESRASTVNVYFPGGAQQIWYDIEDWRPYIGSRSVSVPVTMDKVPAYYRGGSIIPRKDRPRRAASLMLDDPYTLYVVLDAENSASGTLYTDDGYTYGYKNKDYLYIQFKFKDNTLTSSIIDKDAQYPTREWLERVVIVNPPKGIKHAEIKSKGLGTLQLQTSYTGEERSLVVRKPGVSMQEEFIITLL
ncbi:glycoside hydrolase [Oryctes borbonicus]|uniref:Glycoside hydrolase n=1 Tax=Oryctes borbonicus TaxID=1629725 RepID=A0A0T6AZ84_9SCAR|nr:glycoside hydrolase [Oryctes borbonicus]